MIWIELLCWRLFEPLFLALEYLMQKLVVIQPLSNKCIVGWPDGRIGRPTKRLAIRLNLIQSTVSHFGWPTTGLLDSSQKPTDRTFFIYSTDPKKLSWILETMRGTDQWDGQFFFFLVDFHLQLFWHIDHFKWLSEK